MTLEISRGSRTSFLGHTGYRWRRLRANIPASRWSERYGRRLALEDLVGVVVATLAASLVRLSGGGPALRTQPEPVALALALILAAAWFVTLTAARTRHRHVVGLGATEYTKVFSCSWQLFAALAAGAYVLELPVARDLLVVSFPLGLALLLLGRYTARQRLHRERLAGRCTTSVLVLGTPACAADLIATLDRDRSAGLRVVGVCVPSGTTRPGERVGGVPVLGDLVDVPAVASAAEAQVVAVTGSDAVTTGVVRQLGWDLEATGIDLVLAPALTDIAGPRVVTRPVNGTSLLHVDAPRFAGGKYWAKAVFDALCSAAIIVALSPVLLVTAALVKVTSRGPVVFRQERIGLDGRPFTMLKFRSMYADAEARLAEIAHLSEGNGVLFKVRDDPRVTRVGAVLRKFSLDELPQLFNVLMGHMSLVGPRPGLQREVDLYEPHVHRRLLVKPGITGLWQVSGRSDLTWEESVRLDLYYTENWSLFGDLVILARTFRTVVSPHGAY